MNGTLPDSKQIWAAHCDKHYVPIYYRPWWMDCVCGKENWDVCLSLDRGGEVEGALVFYWKWRYGMRVIINPLLTTYTGLWLHPPDNLIKPSSRMAYEKRVCENIVKQLPPHAFFYQQWHPAILNWLPYYWKGFRQTTLYTYILDDLNNVQANFKGMNPSARNHISNSKTNLMIYSDENPQSLFELYSLSLERQGKTPGFNFNQLNKLDAELQKRNSRSILCARDETGSIHSAIYLIWDMHRTYFILSGSDPAFRQSHATTKLLWQAIKTNPGNTLSFDFEGSMLESIEIFFRSFGGTLTPHFRITKAANKWLEALYVFREG